MEAKDLAQIRRFFRSQPKVLAVYLYGSYAKKANHLKSDLDLAVLFKNRPQDPGFILQLAAQLQQLLGNQVRVDLRELNLDLSPVFLAEVIGQGEVIYCACEPSRIDFEVKAMRQIDDSQMIQKINLDYLKDSFHRGTYGQTATV